MVAQRLIKWIVVMVLMVGTRPAVAAEPDGFNGAGWGMAPDAVRQAVKAASWQQLPAGNEFPAALTITRFTDKTTIAGYSALITYYFWENQFFQATAVFDFAVLKNYDFNYNVFRSVDQYYAEIRGKTSTFTNDIYDLLQKKYGKKQAVFKGLDPRFVFKGLDFYFDKERWNFRYNPYEYYNKIVTVAYAQWNYPKTKIIFTINISAPDKRFDYQLSLSSNSITDVVNKRYDQIRMQGL